MKKYKILITGAAGFIGSHLTDYLIEKKQIVYTTDNLSGGFIENVNKKSIFAKLELTNTQITSKYIKKIKPEIIYHLAADASEGRSQFTPIISTNNNYNSFLNVLVPAIKSGLQKIVVVSSMSVYGDQKPPFSEEMAVKPVDIYGVAKSSMEKATKILSDIYGFKYVIIRPHNVYGPRQNLSDPYRNVIGIFINRLLANKNFYIYGNGKQKRAFTYIDDCAPYIAKAGLENFNKQIFNIGPEKPTTINNLAKIILSYFVKDPRNLPKNLIPTYLPSRPVEVVNAYSKNTKAIKLLGFKQSTTLKEGIEKTIKWAKGKGHQKFRYLKELEISSSITPKTWTEKLI